jgi:hypothetical protein
MIVALVWEAYGGKDPFLRHRLFHCNNSYFVYFGAMVQGCLVSQHDFADSNVILFANLSN